MNLASAISVAFLSPCCFIYKQTSWIYNLPNNSLCKRNYTFARYKNILWGISLKLILNAFAQTAVAYIGLITSIQWLLDNHVICLRICVSSRFPQFISFFAEINKFIWTSVLNCLVGNGNFLFLFASKWIRHYLVFFTCSLGFNLIANMYCVRSNRPTIFSVQV